MFLTEANGAILNELEDRRIATTDFEPFFIAGSVGRAAILGQEISITSPEELERTPRKSRLADIDLVAPYVASVNSKIKHSSGVFLDLGMSKTFRFMEDGVIGVHDFYSKDAPLLAELPVSALGLHVLPLSGTDIGVRTTDSCAAIALHDIVGALTMPHTKHKKQIDELRKKQKELCNGLCDKEVLEGVVESVIKVAALQKLGPYLSFKRATKRAAPGLFAYLEDGRVAEAVRRIRRSGEFESPQAHGASIEEVSALIQQLLSRQRLNVV